MKWKSVNGQCRFIFGLDNKILYNIINKNCMLTPRLFYKKFQQEEDSKTPCLFNMKKIRKTYFWPRKTTKIIVYACFICERFRVLFFFSLNTVQHKQTHRTRDGMWFHLVTISKYSIITQLQLLDEIYTQYRSGI
jgi:hypothetical protein